MKAVHIRSYGGPECLEVIDVAAPTVGVDDVLIDVAAIGVNRKDLNQRRGRYARLSTGPEIPGLEVSGHVRDLGPGAVGTFAIGQPVIALVTEGAYAQQVAAPRGQVLQAPTGMDLMLGAAVPEAAATVFDNLIATNRLHPGKIALMHGASGGVGTLAIQVLRAIGVRTIATAGSAEKLAKVAELGADHLIDYTATDFVAVVEEITEGHGADIIFDVVGGPYIHQNLRALASSGLLVLAGMQGGSVGELDVRVLMRKRGTIVSSALRDRTPAEKAEIMAGVGRQVTPLIEDGQVNPVVDSRFRLADAAAAHDYMERGNHVGKVVLVP